MVLCGKQMAKDEESRGGVATPSKVSATEDTAFYTQVSNNFATDIIGPNVILGIFSFCNNICNQRKNSKKHMLWISQMS